VARVTVIAMNHGLIAARGAGNAKDAGTAMDSLIVYLVDLMSMRPLGRIYDILGSGERRAGLNADRSTKAVTHRCRMERARHAVPLLRWKRR